MAVLVLDPDCTYDALRQRLVDWLPVSASSKPLVTGEPEYAVFERRHGERLYYSFNPVCRLRVLEVPSALDANNEAGLPVVESSAIGRWLESGDERVLLRGILAARLQWQPTFLERVRALRTHPVNAVANAAIRASDEVTGAADLVARQVAFAGMHLLEEQLRPMLMALAQDFDGSLSAALRPRPEDYARAFLPSHADIAREAFERVWLESPHVSRIFPVGALHIHLAPAAMLAEDNVLSYRFPGGYRAIASFLDPHRIWVHWKYVRPGETAGLSYDGLAWLDDHWAWFPKPYRVLRGLIPAAT